MSNGSFELLFKELLSLCQLGAAAALLSSPTAPELDTEARRGCAITPGVCALAKNDDGELPCLLMRASLKPTLLLAPGLASPLAVVTVAFIAVAPAAADGAESAGAVAAAPS